MSWRIADPHIAIDTHGGKPYRLWQVDQLAHLSRELWAEVTLMSGELVETRPRTPEEAGDLPQ